MPRTHAHRAAANRLLSTETRAPAAAAVTRARGDAAMERARAGAWAARTNNVNEPRTTGGAAVENTLEITRHQDPDARTVLMVRGEVDVHTAPRLRTALTEQVGRATALVLDVSGAVLIDAAGLRVLTAAQRHAAELGKTPITLRGVRPLLAKTLYLAGLDHLFPREPAPAAALATHRGQTAAAALAAA
jgi:anti-anti-sigma factor